MLIRLSDKLIVDVEKDKVTFYELKAISPLTPEMVDAWMIQQKEKENED